MDKTERYINFIVADLVKGTVVDIDRNIIYYPDYPEDELELDDLEYHTSTHFLYDYIKDKYGARPSDITHICHLYYKELDQMYTYED